MIKLVIEGKDWSEIRIQLAEALETVRRAVPLEAPRTAQERPELEALPDEPPWPAETIPEAAQRIFPESETKIVPAQTPHCTIHQREMKFYPAGTIKSGPRQGQPRGAFYKCTAKVGDKWCDQRRDAAA